LAARSLSAAVGEEAPIRLTLRGLPVLACAAPHRYFVAHGFPVWLLNALVETEAPRIPAGREKGLLFRSYACGECGAPLPTARGETKTFASRLAWRETPAFEAEVLVPVCRCAACGREQARSAAELAKLLPAALVHAFKSAGLKAPG
jgi:hypothetical protein